MAKIGHNVLRYNPKKSLKTQLKATKMGRNPKYRERILEALQTSDRPLNITEVARKTGINYVTVRSILMEFLLKGKVERFESAQAVFYKPRRIS